MPKDFSRTQRVAEQVKRELGEIIQMELSDPRVEWTSVTHVEVSRDTAYADVQVSCIQEAKIPDAVAALTNAAGFLRKELGRRLRIRNIPELRFSADETLHRAARMDDLIAGVRADDAARPNSDSGTDTDNDEKASDEKASDDNG